MAAPRKPAKRSATKPASEPGADPAKKPRKPPDAAASRAAAVTAPAAKAAAPPGYSGTPLPQKLGIKEGHRVVLLAAPAGFAETLAPLPPVQLASKLKAPADVIVLFVASRAELAAQLPSAHAALAPAGGLWIAWPKKAAAKAMKLVTDMTEDVVRELALPRGLVDNKVCAIDDTWSGLRLVIRKELR